MYKLISLVIMITISQNQFANSFYANQWTHGQVANGLDKSVLETEQQQTEEERATSCINEYIALENEIELGLSNVQDKSYTRNDAKIFKNLLIKKIDVIDKKCSFALLDEIIEIRKQIIDGIIE